MQFRTAAATGALDGQSVWDHIVNLEGVAQTGRFNFHVSKCLFGGRSALYGEL